MNRLYIHVTTQSINIKPHRVRSKRGSISPSWTTLESADGNYISVELSKDTFRRHWIRNQWIIVMDTQLSITRNQHIGIIINGMEIQNSMESPSSLIWAEQKVNKSQIQGENIRLISNWITSTCCSSSYVAIPSTLSWFPYVLSCIPIPSIIMPQCWFRVILSTFCSTVNS